MEYQEDKNLEIEPTTKKAMDQKPRWVLLNKQSHSKIDVVKSLMTVGRCVTADIVCYNQNVSRNHAYIAVNRMGDLYVGDNKSLNGTSVNFQMIKPNVFFKLKNHDILAFTLYCQPDPAGCHYIFEVLDSQIAETHVYDNQVIQFSDIDFKSEPPGISKTDDSVSDGECSVVSSDDKFITTSITSSHFEVPISRKRSGEIQVSASTNKRSKTTGFAEPVDEIENIEIQDKIKYFAQKYRKNVSIQSKIKASSSRGNFLIKPVERIPNLGRKRALENPTAVLPHTVCSSPKNVPSTSAAFTSQEENQDEAVAILHGNIPLSNTHEILEDILMQVLSWNPDWFRAKNFNNSLPPINKSPLVMFRKNFSSFAEYYSIVLPHWLMELWYFFRQEHVSPQDRFKKSFQAHLEKCTNNGNFIELQCFVFISKEKYDLGCHIQVEDVVLLDTTFGNKEKFKRVLGCVGTVNKTLLTSNSAICHDLALLTGKTPYALIEFNVLIKTNNEIQSFKKTIEMHLFTNVASSWNLFESIKYLQYSPLCQYILKPNLQNYQQGSNKINLNTLDIDARLNDSQKCAVANATKFCLGSSPGIFMIKGPPGTGKSTVIVNIVKQILFEENQKGSRQCILLVAPTNKTVDELVVQLIHLRSKLKAKDKKKLKIIRFGYDRFISRTAKSESLTVLAKTNVMQTCQKLKNNYELVELKNQIITLKSQLGENPQYQVELNAKNELLENKCREIMGRSYTSELTSEEQKLLNDANIICTTLSGCSGARMVEVFSNTTKLSCCIVDDATLSTEQETFVPLKLGISKLVLVGDPMQQPRVTYTKEIKKFGHGKSLFVRLNENFSGLPKNLIQLLNVQYRMHPEICSFPNQIYYNNLLQTDSNVAKRENPINALLHPYLVFQMENNLKTHNQLQNYESDCETKFILTFVQAIVGILPKSHKINIGIITPYIEQKDSIIQLFQENKFHPNVSILVHTVESYQGQERDIVILSNVRIFPKKFLAVNQRLNVALTRAKYALYVIGTISIFKTCEIFGKLQFDSRDRKLLKHIPLTVDVSHLTKLIHKTVLNK